MANIHDCLQRAIDAGDLDRNLGREAQGEFEQLVDRLIGSMPRAQAEAEAARILREATQVKAIERRHARIAQLQSYVRLQGQIDGALDPAKALKSLLEFDDGSAVAGFQGESVRSLSQAIQKSFMADIADFLRETGNDALGRSRNPARIRNVIRELHGQKSGDAAAAELGGAIRHAQERARQMFNAHGGNIGKLADYGVSHSHDVRRIRTAGFDAWADAIFDRLDWGRIIDNATGKPFITTTGGRPNREAGTAFLRRIYDQITTEGWISRDPSSVSGGRALYNQRAEHRILHFKDGDAWMDYNAEFGAGDPFSAIVGGLRSMAGDIALMRVLGPNPKAGLEFASQVAVRRAALAGDQAQLGNVRKAADTARLMLGHLDGSYSTPAAGAEGWAAFWSGTRGVLSSAQLGSAFFSSVTDMVTVRAGARAAGLNPNNVVARAMSLMADGNAQRQAANAGFIMDSLAEMSQLTARMGLDEMMPEVARRLSSFTMRASLLTRWTDAWRVAAQMEFSSVLGVNAGRSFDALEPQLRETLSRRGITSADWDRLRADDTLYRPTSDTAFVSPQHWLQHTDMPRAEAEGLALRLQMAIEEHLEMMVPTYNLQAKARILGEAQPGTMRGEFLRGALQYKSWPIAFTMGQIQRIRFGTGGNRAAYAAATIAGVTVMGALAVQLKELAKGRDARPMTDTNFWLAAFAQGGGAGIFGDFLFSTESRAGGGLAETLSGPQVGLASAAIGIGWRNARALATGDKTSLGRDVSQFARYNTPVFSSLWYARAGFDRLVADNLQRMLDPDAESSLRQRARRQASQYGNDFWWRPGETQPARAPDLTSAARPR